MHKTVIIIPARGGSKRFPNKNIQLLGGKPLIVHSIEYAQNHCSTAKIIVSTDSLEIKKIALHHNVDVVDRPPELSGDESSTVSALQHTLAQYVEDFKTVVLLQPTNPLRPKNLFKAAYAQFIEGNYDSLMSVTRNHQKFGKIMNSKFVPLNYEIGQRSQDLEPLYFENGLLYITKANLIKVGKLVGEKNLPYILNHPFAHVDIDTKEDLNYAEYLYNTYKIEA